MLCLDFVQSVFPLSYTEWTNAVGSKLPPRWAWLSIIMSFFIAVQPKFNIVTGGWLILSFLQAVSFQSACLQEQSRRLGWFYLLELIGYCWWILSVLSTFTRKTPGKSLVEKQRASRNPEELWEARPLMDVRLICSPVIGGRRFNRLLDRLSEGLRELVIRIAPPALLTVSGSQIRYALLILTSWITSLAPSLATTYFALWLGWVGFLTVSQTDDMLDIDFGSFIQHYALEVDGQIYELKRGLTVGIRLRCDSSSKLLPQRHVLSNRVIGKTFFTADEIKERAENLIAISPGYDPIQYSCQAMAYNLALRILDDRGNGSDARMPLPRRKMGYRAQHMAAFQIMLYSIWFQLRFGTKPHTLWFEVVKYVFAFLVELHLVQYTWFWAFTWQGKSLDYRILLPQIIAGLIITSAIRPTLPDAEPEFLGTLDPYLRFLEVLHLVIMAFNVISGFAYWRQNSEDYVDDTIVSQNFRENQYQEEEDSISIVIKYPPKLIFDSSTGPLTAMVGAKKDRQHIFLTKKFPLWDVISDTQKTEILHQRNDDGDNIEKRKTCCKSPPPKQELFRNRDAVLIFQQPSRKWFEGVWMTHGWSGPIGGRSKPEDENERWRRQAWNIAWWVNTAIFCRQMYRLPEYLSDWKS